MYINFNLLDKEGLTLYDLGLLLAVRQKELDIFRKFYSQPVNVILQKGYIEPLKSGKGYKMTSKGTTFLNLLQIPQLEDEHKIQYAKLMDSYTAIGLSKDKLGNTKKGLSYFVSFMAETGFDFDDVLDAVEDYLQENSKEPMYIRQLSSLICKPSNVYSTKFQLSESKLYNLVKDRL